MGEVKTYNPKEVIFSCGSHAVTGYDEDSFIIIEKQGDGVRTRVGCDGEIGRSLDPNTQYKITFKLLQTSESNAWFQNKYNQDAKTGQGMFAVTVKDLSGTLVFSADESWVVKPARREYGREGTAREWELDTGEGQLEE